MGDNKEQNSTNINWYPGHMAKARRQIQEKLELIDIILEVIDARIPYSSKIKDLDTLTKSKPRILIMTKYDLCDKSITDMFKREYEKAGYFVLTVDLMHGSVKKPILATIENILAPMNEKRIQKGLKARSNRDMVIGVPNVGKSTLINQLVGKKAVGVGNRPGVTKSLDWIRINQDLELMDTPGILWPKIEEEEVAYNLASFTAIKEEILPLDRVSFYMLQMLQKYYPECLKERYKIKEDITSLDIYELYEIIGKQRGAIAKGGEIDYDKVASILVNDIKMGHIKNITFDRRVSHE